MNGKMSQNYGDDASLETELLNPFIHRLELSTTYDKIKTAVFTVAVLPFRVAAICGLLMIAWCLACIGLCGLSESELRSKPMTGWRKATKMVICTIMRALFVAGGFHWVTVKGKQATPKEAPVLAVAPHSSYSDALAVIYLGAPSVVAKGEIGQIPFFGKLINYTQPVYVWREDPHSRQNTIKEIIERANSKLNWPQVLIFPEGTCTNRSCLITFKAGAFYPGVPVQPVCIRYPNKLDTVTWTWEGPGVLKLLWLTLTQVHSCCEIEFLPVYKPSEEEIYDPRLFANNVRKVMAKALGVPVSNYTYDDCRLMTRAKQMNLPFAGHLIEMQKLRNTLGLTKTNPEESIIVSDSFRSLKNGYSVSLKEFSEMLMLSPTDPAVVQLFKLCDTNFTGFIDFREYLLTVLVISKNGNLSEMLFLMFKLMDEEGSGRIRESVFCSVLHQALSMSIEHCSSIFRQIDKSRKGYVTFDEFKSYGERHKEFSNVFKQNSDAKPKSE
ncbi:UNVERIFIED_CONTAM: hypothetical protein PYX00_008584 [Menopon gallinae]|uniref:EF-hand domain-containing protein n=1 Tax=Menopon gallinae TaxID=328185 RepID=A0AAW2HNV6_9NEOP